MFSNSIIKVGLEYKLSINEICLKYKLSKEIENKIFYYILKLEYDEKQNEIIQNKKIYQENLLLNFQKNKEHTQKLLFQKNNHLKTYKYHIENNGENYICTNCNNLSVDTRMVITSIVENIRCNELLCKCNFDYYWNLYQSQLQYDSDSDSDYSDNEPEKLHRIALYNHIRNNGEDYKCTNCNNITVDTRMTNTNIINELNKKLPHYCYCCYDYYIDYFVDDSFHCQYLNNSEKESGYFSILNL